MTERQIEVWVYKEGSQTGSIRQLFLAHDSQEAIEWADRMPQPGPGLTFQLVEKGQMLSRKAWQWEMAKGQAGFPLHAAAFHVCPACGTGTLTTDDAGPMLCTKCGVDGFDAFQKEVGGDGYSLEKKGPSGPAMTPEEADRSISAYGHFVVKEGDNYKVRWVSGKVETLTPQQLVERARAIYANDSGYDYVTGEDVPETSEKVQKGEADGIDVIIERDRFDSNSFRAYERKDDYVYPLYIKGSTPAEVESQVRQKHKVSRVTVNDAMPESPFESQRQTDKAADAPFAKARRQPSKIEPAAYALGQQAFKSGKYRAPAQDPALMAMIPAGTPVGSDNTLILLNSWSKGFTDANLAKPIPGLSDEENAAFPSARRKAQGDEMGKAEISETEAVEGNAATTANEAEVHQSIQQPNLIHFHIPWDATDDELETLVEALRGLGIGQEPPVTKFDSPNLESNELQQQMANDKGFTYQPGSKRSPTSGMVVSINPDLEEEVEPRDLTARKLREYRDKNMERFKNDPQAHMGGWYDAQKKKVFLDVSHLAADHAEARKLAVQYRQDAYFDLGTFTTHYVFAKSGKPPADELEANYDYHGDTQTWTRKPGTEEQGDDLAPDAFGMPGFKGLASSTLRKMRVLSYSDAAKYLQAANLDLNDVDVQAFLFGVKAALEAKQPGQAFEVDVIAMATDQFKLEFSENGTPLVEANVGASGIVRGLNGSRYQREGRATNRVYGRRAGSFSRAESAEMQKAGWGFKITGETLDDYAEAEKLIRANFMEAPKVWDIMRRFKNRINMYQTAKNAGDTEYQPPQLEMTTTRDQAGQSIERMFVLNTWQNGEYTTEQSARIGGESNLSPTSNPVSYHPRAGYRTSSSFNRAQGASMFKLSSFDDIGKAMGAFSRANEAPVTVDGLPFYAGVHKNPRTQRWTALVKDGGRTGPIIGESQPMLYRAQAVEFIKTTVLEKAQTILPLRGVQASPRNFMAKERQSAEQQISAYLGQPVTIQKTSIQLGGRAIGTLTSKAGVAVAIFDDAVMHTPFDQPDLSGDLPPAVMPDEVPEEFYYAALAPMRKAQTPDSVVVNTQDELVKVADATYFVRDVNMDDLLAHSPATLAAGGWFEIKPVAKGLDVVAHCAGGDVEQTYGLAFTTPELEKAYHGQMQKTVGEWVTPNTGPVGKDTQQTQAKLTLADGAHPTLYGVVHQNSQGWSAEIQQGVPPGRKIAEAPSTFSTREEAQAWVTEWAQENDSEKVTKGDKGKATRAAVIQWVKENGQRYNDWLDLGLALNDAFDEPVTFGTKDEDAIERAWDESHKVNRQKMAKVKAGSPNSNPIANERGYSGNGSNVARESSGSHWEKEIDFPNEPDCSATIWTVSGPYRGADTTIVFRVEIDFDKGNNTRSVVLPGTYKTFAEADDAMQAKLEELKNNPPAPLPAKSQKKAARAPMSKGDPIDELISPALYNARRGGAVKPRRSLNPSWSEEKDVATANRIGADRVQREQMDAKLPQVRAQVEQFIEAHQAELDKDNLAELRYYAQGIGAGTGQQVYEKLRRIFTHGFNQTGTQYSPAMRQEAQAILDEMTDADMAYAARAPMTKANPAPTLDARQADDVRPIHDVVIDTREWAQDQGREPILLDRGQWTFLIGAKRETAEVVNYTGTYAAASDTASAYAAAKGEKKITLAVSAKKVMGNDMAKALQPLIRTGGQPKLECPDCHQGGDTPDEIMHSMDCPRHDWGHDGDTAPDAYRSHANNAEWAATDAMGKADAGLTKPLAALRATIKDAEAYDGPRHPMLASALANAKGTLSGIDNPPAGRRNTLTAKDIERVTWNLRNAMQNAV